MVIPLSNWPPVLLLGSRQITYWLCSAKNSFDFYQRTWPWRALGQGQEVLHLAKLHFLSRHYSAMTCKYVVPAAGGRESVRRCLKMKIVEKLSFCRRRVTMVFHTLLVCRARTRDGALSYCVNPQCRLQPYGFAYKLTITTITHN